MGIYLNIECQKIGAMLNRMEELIEATEGDGKELLFKFCESSGGRVSSSHETAQGTEKKVPLQEIRKINCPEKHRNRGTFHTHPSGTSKPSAGDILFHLNELSDAFCIGSRQIGGLQSDEGSFDTLKNVIKCYRIDWNDMSKTSKMRNLASQARPIEEKILDMGRSGGDEFLGLVRQYLPLIDEAAKLLSNCEIIRSSFNETSRIVGIGRKNE